MREADQLIGPRPEPRLSLCARGSELCTSRILHARIIPASSLNPPLGRLIPSPSVLNESNGSCPILKKKVGMEQHIVS